MAAGGSGTCCDYESAPGPTLSHTFWPIATFPADASSTGGLCVKEESQKERRGLPWPSSAHYSVLPTQDAWLRSLIGGTKIPHGWKKKEREKETELRALD